MGFPSQEHCSGLPFPPPGDLRDPGVESVAPALQAGRFCAASQCKWGDFVQFAFPAKPEWSGHLYYWFM